VESNTTSKGVETKFITKTIFRPFTGPSSGLDVSYRRTIEYVALFYIAPIIPRDLANCMYDL
jgi:hypothetical protein